MLAGCRSTVISCVLPFISTLSGHVLMVSDLGFFFSLGRFDSRQFGARVSSRWDKNSSRLSLEVVIQRHSQSWAQAASTAKRRLFTSCACVRSCRGGAMNTRFKLYADLLLVRLCTNFFLVIISAFAIFWAVHKVLVLYYVHITLSFATKKFYLFYLHLLRCCLFHSCWTLTRLHTLIHSCTFASPLYLYGHGHNNWVWPRCVNGAQAITCAKLASGEQIRQEKATAHKKYELFVHRRIALKFSLP